MNDVLDEYLDSQLKFFDGLIEKCQENLERAINSPDRPLKDILIKDCQEYLDFLNYKKQSLIERQLMRRGH